MKTRIFLILLAFCLPLSGLFAQNAVFEDNFEDNRNGWDVRDQGDFYSSVYNGQYLIKCRSEDKAWWELRDMPYDVTQDFEIESVIKQYEGTTDQGYGLVWGLADRDNFFSFTVNTDGNFHVMAWEDGESFDVSEGWMDGTGAVRHGSRANKLKILREGDMTYFYVNDQKVFESEFPEPYGTQVGFLCNGRMSISADNLVLRQKNGLSDIFAEEFDDNSNDWKILDTQYSRTAIKRGAFWMQRLKESGSGYYTNRVPINPEAGYEIETELLQLDGVTNHGYGLVWGMSDVNNFNAFIVNGNGSFSIYYYEDNHWTDVAAWTRSRLIETSGGVNRLKISKEGDDLVYFINNEEVFRSEVLSFYGTKAGYVLHRNMSVTADYFSVRQASGVEVEEDHSPPEVHWVEPVASFSQTSEEVNKIQIGINSATAIVTAEILVNNRPISQSMDAGFEVESSGDADRYDLFLNKNIRLKPGNNTVSVRVTNKSGATTTEDIRIGVISGKKVSPPTVSWTSPAVKESSVEAKLEYFKIEAKVNSQSPIVAAKVFVNDLEIRDRGFEVEESTTETAEGYTVRIDRQISLDLGVNKVEIRTENRDGAKAVSHRIINRESRMSQKIVVNSKTGRTDYALFIAGDNYDKWGDLVNPVNDARTLANELKESYGFRTEVLENASKREILSKLKEYARRTYNTEDQLLVFFAGHGKFDEEFSEGYVVCKNSLKDDDGNSSYISHSTLRTITNNIPSQHTMLLMDVCFGGTFDPKIATGNRGETDARTVSEDMIKRKLKFKTRKYLTSGGKEYVPDGAPGKHSPFARKFLEALRNYGGNDKVLTTGELLLYFKGVQPVPRFGEFGNNEPGSDFMFFAK